MSSCGVPSISIDLNDGVCMMFLLMLLLTVCMIFPTLWRRWLSPALGGQQHQPLAMPLAEAPAFAVVCLASGKLAAADPQVSVHSTKHSNLFRIRLAAADLALLFHSE